MKSKLAITACAAALALSATPAMASEAVPGTCYEQTRTLLGRSLSWWDCECIIGAPWVTDYYFSPDPLQFHVTITYCHAGERIPH